MFSFFTNLPNVTKNILILNILFYLASLVMLSKGIDLVQMLGAHYIGTPLFQPYQIVTHFFMHSTQTFFHIFLNMMVLVMFGSHLERIWGSKRFFLFYLISALGAFALYNGIGVYQIMELKSQILGFGIDINVLNDQILKNDGHILVYSNDMVNAVTTQYQSKALSPMVGASGAMFGLMAAFGYLFPNTELMLLFFPVPVKAKYLISAYFLFELFSSFVDRAGDNVAHLAHVGGAVAGFIMVLVWNKRNKKNFY